MYESGFSFQSIRTDPRVGRWYAQFQSRPSWVWRVALAAAMVIVVPVVAMFLAAVITFLVVFAAASLLNILVQTFRSLLGGRAGDPTDEGRRNVRVIRIE
jgi:hypothetical protein